MNSSIAHHADPGVCNSLGYSEVIRENSDLLWVFSAGNHGKTLGRNNNFICPQGLGEEHSNMLVVNTTSWQYSNRGKEFVDLTTDEDSTSHAAVKVSNVAAQISQNYPRFNSQTIKHIIITSTDEGNWNVRSKGKLNEERVWKFAKSISDGESLLETFKEYGTIVVGGRVRINVWKKLGKDLVSTDYRRKNNMKKRISLYLLGLFARHLYLF